MAYQSPTINELEHPAPAQTLTSGSNNDDEEVDSKDGILQATNMMNGNPNETREKPRESNGKNESNKLLLKKLERLTKRNLEIVSNLKESRKKTEDAEKKVREKDRNLEELNKSTEELGRQLSEWKLKSAKSQKTIEAMGNKLEEYERALRSVHTPEDQERRVFQLETLNQGLNSTRANLEERIGELEDQIRNLVTARNEDKKRLAELQGQRENLEGRNTQLEQVNAELSRENERLKAMEAGEGQRTAELVQKIKKLEGKAEEQEVCMGNLKEKHKRLREFVEKYHAQINNCLKLVGEEAFGEFVHEDRDQSVQEMLDRCSQEYINNTLKCWERRMVNRKREVKATQSVVEGIMETLTRLKESQKSDPTTRARSSVQNAPLVTEISYAAMAKGNVSTSTSTSFHRPRVFGTAHGIDTSKSLEIHCLCGRNMKTLSNLKMHLKITSTKKRFKCHHCPRRFQFPVNWRNHLRREHKIKGCKLCGKACTTPTALQFHRRLVHARQLLMHSRTSSGATDKQVHPQESSSNQSSDANASNVNPDLENFMGSPEGPPISKPAHGENSECSHLGYFCFCSYQATTRARLTEHIKYHNELRTYPCPICKMTFPTAGTLKSHCWEQHNKRFSKSSLVCRHCGNCFRSRKLLNIHRRADHADKLFTTPKVILSESSSRRTGSLPESIEIKANPVPGPSTSLEPATPSIVQQDPIDNVSLIPPPDNTVAPAVSLATADVASRTQRQRKPTARFHSAYKENPSLAQFTCIDCPRKFSAIISLKAHARQMHNQIYPMSGCTDCGSTFPTYSELRRHRRLYNCLSSRPDSGRLRMKVPINSKGKAGRPFITGRRGLLLDNKKKHGMNPTPEGIARNACLCNLQYPNKDKLKRHVWYANLLKQFPCLKCHRQFKTTAIVQTHMWDIHRTKYHMKGCTACGALCNNMDELQRHKSQNCNRTPDSGEPVGPPVLVPAPGSIIAAVVPSPPPTPKPTSPVIPMPAAEVLPAKRKPPPALIPISAEVEVVMRQYGNSLNQVSPTMRAPASSSTSCSSTLHPVHPSSLTSNSIQSDTRNGTIVFPTPNVTIMSTPSQNPTRTTDTAPVLEPSTPSSGTAGLFPRATVSTGQLVIHSSANTATQIFTTSDHALDRTKLELGYFCICGLQFARQENLAAHTQFFMHGKRFPCKLCNKSFVGNNDLNAHTKRSHATSNLKQGPGCRFCGVIFANRHEFCRHRPKIFINRKWTTNYCPAQQLVASPQQALSSQIAGEASGNTRNSMPVNPSTSSRTGNQGPHPSSVASSSLDEFGIRHGVDPAKTIKRNKKFYCVCGQQTKSMDNLKKHIRWFTQRNFTCEMCSSRFLLAGQLKKHMFVKHKRVLRGGPACKDCAEVFPDHNELRIHHQVVHNFGVAFETELKHAPSFMVPVVSSQDQGQTQESSLEILIDLVGENSNGESSSSDSQPAGNSAEMHRKVPNDPLSDDNTVKCFCGKAFSSTSSLGVHIRSKTLGKRFVCIWCPGGRVRYDLHGNLKQHVRKVHPNVRYEKYACGTCAQTFATYDQICNHRRLEHGK